MSIPQVSMGSSNPTPSCLPQFGGAKSFASKGAHELEDEFAEQLPPMNEDESPSFSKDPLGFLQQKIAKNPGLTTLFIAIPTIGITGFTLRSRLSKLFTSNPKPEKSAKGFIGKAKKATVPIVGAGAVGGLVYSVAASTFKTVYGWFSGGAAAKIEALETANKALITRVTKLEAPLQDRIAKAVQAAFEDSTR